RRHFSRGSLVVWSKAPAFRAFSPTLASPRAECAEYGEFSRCPCRQRVERDLPTVGVCVACATPPVDKAAAQHFGSARRRIRRAVHGDGSSPWIDLKSGNAARTSADRRPSRPVRPSASPPVCALHRRIL